MSSRKNVTGTVVLLIAGACMLLAAAPAGAQQTDWWSGAGTATANDYMYLAQQPTPAPGAAPQANGQPGGQPAVEPVPEAEVPLPQYDQYEQLAAQIPFTELASVPNMFGDFFFSSGTILQSFYDDLHFPGSDLHSYVEGAATIPLAGASRRVKISENNKALPMDRVYFMYNFFDNALQASSLQGPEISRSVNRYTLGAEKTFFRGWSSVEVRMPLVERVDYELPDFSVIGGPTGNLAVDVKQLLYGSDRFALAMGLGIDTPTGSNVRGRAGRINYLVHNDSVHLLPWVGFLHQPTERLFWEGFLQWDIAANGNRVATDSTLIGRYTEQNLMYVDVSVGYWVYRNPCGRVLTALAPILEFHYTSTMQDTDVLMAPAGGSYFYFVNPDNRVDVTNLTVGLHSELGMTTVGVAGVFPLTGGSNKCFDSELQLYINRYF